MSARTIFKVTFYNIHMRMPITYGVPQCDLANLIKWITKPGANGEIIDIAPIEYDAETDDTGLVILPHDTWGYLLYYSHRSIMRFSDKGVKQLWVSRDSLDSVIDAMKDKGYSVSVRKSENKILDRIYNNDSVSKDMDGIADNRELVSAEGITPA